MTSQSTLRSCSNTPHPPLDIKTAVEAGEHWEELLRKQDDYVSMASVTRLFRRLRKAKVLKLYVHLTILSQSVCVC